MAEPPASPAPRRAACGRCGLPLKACLCRWIRPTANEVEVLILQHPDEARHAKNSARLLRLSLSRCTVVVGETLDAAMLAERLARPATDGATPVNMLLYPETPASLPALAPAAEMPRHALGEAAAAQRLVVLDATWGKSLKMLLSNPLLQALPRVVLDGQGPSRYLIRRARRPGQMSTLEASCLALARLEDAPGRYAPLLEGFDGFVQDRLRPEP